MALVGIFMRKTLILRPILKPYQQKTFKIFAAAQSNNPTAINGPDPPPKSHGKDPPQNNNNPPKNKDTGAKLTELKEDKVNSAKEEGEE
ncbi:hypothetical protein HHK36_019896 [Tetracentron sinense]|uniref:Uncharacterized protein n=1 Tax=Tetracentron sinense TaxID=13715 RepID=A0A834YYD3_TETSI|nr:hypothetical protein HHK36_019896 [Tetracentron sinense]